VKICSRLVGHVAPRKGHSRVAPILNRMGVNAQVSVFRVSGFIPDDPRGSAATSARALVRPPARVGLRDRDRAGSEPSRPSWLTRVPGRLITRDPVCVRPDALVGSQYAAGCGEFRN
jgi:hypothetical protein